MPLFEAVRLALQTIRVQKLKSFFTLLGVMIGVMFLIAVVSIVEGMSDYVENDFAAKIIGTNTFDVSRTPSFVTDADDEQWRAWQRRPRLFDPEAEAVRNALPGDFRIARVNQSFLPATVPGLRPRSVQAVATDATYFDIKKFALTAGRAFTQQEVATGARVVVIGSEVASYYYEGLDPVGRELRVAGLPYTIIGVIEEQGSVFGFSMDRLAIAPVTTPLTRAINPRGDIDAITVQAGNRELITEGMELSREALRGFRGLGPSEEDDFALTTSSAALSFFDGLKSKLVLFGTALPAIGLVVGALVIMNIMLVAVSERTREIGVRKALGARRRDIIAQFLVEASTLSIIGAMIGAACGVGLAKLIAAVTPLPASVAPWSLVAALIVGAGVGITAGIYPASRAARLDPIAALRQE
ncbi:MAG: ABC transporter permease [Gemmatimonadota bacterium]|nr:ABC transporter permease [Gemmatimonadota bacterium]MDQ8150407.1 ABC transporter permease [Gemmatimonadota bacterium]MDQ8151945.1 ABC transporter permease [Gemmatimonadota bacterium]MDQ8169753.1 ABC transporter permease [Gemmatimonadota bacterium]MDQ8178892.1 ABC transporter permease [Gemmatimonadota bacterium]